MKWEFGALILWSESLVILIFYLITGCVCDLLPNNAYWALVSPKHVSFSIFVLPELCSEKRLCDHSFYIVTYPVEHAIGDCKQRFYLTEGILYFKTSQNWICISFDKMM